MASIRRTLSPAYHDRHYSLNSPSHKFSSKNNYYSIAAALHRRGSRRVLLRCGAFFLVGFLLGMMPYDRPDHDVRDRRFYDGDLLSIPPPPPFPEEKFDVRLGTVEFVPRKQIIVVTPTYARAAQAYFLNRIGQVLRLVPAPVVWIVVEMSSASMETAEVLRKTGVMYRHLVCNRNSSQVKDRGVHQRNTALGYIERHRLDGIVFFADDDNVYSLSLFYSLRNISRFGTWPVAMLAHSKNKAVLEGPVCNGSQVIGWHTNEKSKRLRRFHVDMSGFSFNSTILWDPKRWRRPTSTPIRQLDTVKEGFQETTFIEQVVEDENQMEGTPGGCTEVLNWRLHLEVCGVDYPKGWVLQKNLEADLPLVD